jgi:hypothetical protein
MKYRRTHEAGVAAAMRMLRAHGRGGDVWDILAAAKREDGHEIAMASYDQYRWMVDDTERAAAWRELAEAMGG